jgi:RNA polymerase sigma-70 factor, ECF subfamily
MELTATGPTPRERALLAAARAGDENAYQLLIEPHRRELRAHCYRMLGSMHDADDAVQDALLRAWRGLPRFEGRSTTRSWLYKITTNACLNAIARQPKGRVLPVDFGEPGDPHGGAGAPLVESVWMQPYPDERLDLGDDLAAPDARYDRRESVELAFVAALQHLPANQRAVLIMREVLGFSAKESADALDTTVASINSALQRARKTIDDKLPERSQQATLRALGDEKLRAIVDTYMDALARGDVPRVVSMLAEDAAWSMPPLPTWFRGFEGIEGFLRFGPLSGQWRWRHLPVRVNGQIASAAYQWSDDEQAYLPFALDTITLEGDRIKEVTAFITRMADSADREFYARWPDQPLDRARFTFERFGLPASLPAA